MPHKGTSSTSSFDFTTPEIPSQFNFGVDFSSKDATSKDTSYYQHPKGIYAIYKEATNTFKDDLSRLLPSKKFRLSSVGDYKKAADWILSQTSTWLDSFEKKQKENEKEKNGVKKHSSNQRTNSSKHKHQSKLIVIHKEDRIFTNLDLCIRYRHEQMKRHGDHDQGHLYAVSVLSYCREVLHYCQKITRLSSSSLVPPPKQKSEKKQRRKQASPTDLRDVWDVELNYDSEDDSCKGTQQPPLPLLPIPVAPPTPTLPHNNDAAADEEDMIQAGDRFQCVAFLDTLDRLMGIVRDQFSNIKEICFLNVKEDEASEEENVNILHSLMKAAVATEVATECIQSTWAELTLGLPHIRTIYDLIAIVYINPIIFTAKSMQIKHENLLSRSNSNSDDDDLLINPRHPHILNHFVGDVIEACFTNEEGLDLTRPLKSFSDKLALPDGNWEKQLILEDAQRLGKDIVDLVLEPRYPSRKIRRAFLRSYKFIGGHRCILNTQLQLQSALTFAREKYKKGEKDGIKAIANCLAEAGRNSYGTNTRQERKALPAVRGVQCLDGLLTSEILPELVAASMEGYADTPGRLVPLLSSLADFLNNTGGAAVPIDLTFGFHAMMISILEVQGNGHLELLATKADVGCNGMMDQLQTDSKCNGQKLLLSFFQRVIEPDWDPVSDCARSVAYWNPLMSGYFSIFAVYSSKICGTLSLKKSSLRSVLHLYNALRCRDLLEPIDFLDWVDRIFESCPSIWFASKGTTQGVFSKNYLLGTGLSVRDISVIVSGLKTENGIKIDLYRFSDDRQKDLSFNPAMMTHGMGTSQYSQGFCALILKNYTMLDGEKDDNSPVLGTLECEDVIAIESGALQSDIDLFGGSFVDVAKIGVVMAAFCDRLDKELQLDGRCGPMNCVEILAEIDFVADSKLRRAPIVACVLRTFFTEYQRSHFSFSDGL